MKTTELKKEPSVNQQIEKAVLSYMEKSYYLYSIDRNDSLKEMAGTIDYCFTGFNPEPFYDELTNSLWLDREIFQQETERIVAEISENPDYKHLKPYLKQWQEEGTYFVEEIMRERDTSDPVKEWIANTSLRARAILFTNEDLLTPFPEVARRGVQYEGYFKQIIDTLYLNPAKVKRMFEQKEIKVSGRWTNLPYREGKEAVSYESFIEELEEQTGYALLVFMGMYPLQDIYDHKFQKYNYLIIPKGNRCGFLTIQPEAAPCSIWF